MLMLTFWERPNNWDGNPDSYEGLFDVRIKSVKEIPSHIAVAAKQHKGLVAVSIEHTGFRTLKDGRKTNFFKFIWEKGNPIPKYQPTKCPLCKSTLENRKEN